MRNSRKTAAAVAALLSIGLIAAACGGDDDDAGETTTTEAGAATTAAGGAATTAAGGAATTAAAGQQGGSMKFAAEQEPAGFNCIYIDSNEAWCDYIIQDLTWPSATDAQPNAIAEPTSVVTSVELTSEDPQVVTYKINPDAVWSDGTPITADDFMFTWETQNGTNAAYKYASDNGYKDISEVKAGADEKEVIVTYSKPYADWKSLFDPLVNRANFTELGGGDPVKGFNDALLAESADVSKMLSGGPYKVKSYTAGQNIVLERNDAYWGEPAPLDELVFPFITDSSQQPQAYANGEIDGGFPQAQIDLVQQIQGLDGAESIIGFGSFWEHLDFNSTNPILADLAVRKAIALAIDRQAIVTALPGQVSDEAEVLNNHIFQPGSDGYVDNGGEYAAADLDAANAALDAAGWVKGSDGIRAKDGQKMTLRIAWRDPNPRRKATAELVQSNLKDIGIDGVLDPKPDFTFLDDGDWDLVDFGWTGGVALASSESIYSVDGSQNYGKIADPQQPDLWAEANVELDPAARIDLMNQIDELIWAQMHSLPLYQVPEPLFWRDSFTGLAYNGYDGPTWNGGTWSAAA